MTSSKQTTLSSITSKFIRTLSFLITVILCTEYIDYLISVFSYPFNIFQNEGFSTRISLYFYSNGLKLGNLIEYPGILTIYGFLYELVCVPLLMVMDPSVNIGRIISLVSIIFIIGITFLILKKKYNNWYYITGFAILVILFKPLAIYTCLSKIDSFAACMTLVVVYSLYFHKGVKQFLVTFMFTCFALLTKQTTVFIIPVVLCWWFIVKQSSLSFARKAVLWLGLILSIFGLLCLVIPNYYFNTITLSAYIGTVTTSFKRLVLNQAIPLVRGTGFYFLTVLFVALSTRKILAFRDLLTPASIYIFFYLPLFLYTSLSTGSMPVYFIFTFIGISIFVPEFLNLPNSANLLNKTKNKLVVELLFLMQLIIFLLVPSKIDSFKLSYIKPTAEELEQSNQIDSIIRNYGIENSFVTFSRSSYGLSKKSAPNDFDFIHGYLLQNNKLNVDSYIRDFESKKFSILVGSLDYHPLKEAIDRNYYLFMIVGNTPLFLPRK